jgi:hypothetical protein
MTMAQVWPLVGAMVGIFGTMGALVLRSMSMQRAELSAKIDGLRNEMNARFEPLTKLIDRLDGRIDKLDDKVDRIDRDVRDLSKAVLSGSPPQSI